MFQTSQTYRMYIHTWCTWWRIVVVGAVAVLPVGRDASRRRQRPVRARGRVGHQGLASEDVEVQLPRPCHLLLRKLVPIVVYIGYEVGFKGGGWARLEVPGVGVVPHRIRPCVYHQTCGTFLPSRSTFSSHHPLTLVQRHCALHTSLYAKNGNSYAKNGISRAKYLQQHPPS